MTKALYGLPILKESNDDRVSKIIANTFPVLCTIKECIIPFQITLDMKYEEQPAYNTIPESYDGLLSSPSLSNVK